MSAKTVRWGFESRIRTVLLVILLASLLVQAGTALLLDHAQDAMEMELLNPLFVALDELTIAVPVTNEFAGGLWRRSRGLERRQQFFLHDTTAATVAAAWEQIPPASRRRLLQGEATQIYQEHDGTYDLLVYRLVGPEGAQRVLCAGRTLPAYGRFLDLQRWNAGVRTIGLLLLLGAVFIVTRELSRPLQQLRRVSEDARSRFRLEERPTTEEWETISATFEATIERLKASQAQLEARFQTSEEERQRLQDLNVRIIDALPLGLLSADGEGRIVRFNRSAADLPALQPPATGLSLAEFFAPWPELARRFARRPSNGWPRDAAECKVEVEGEAHYIEYQILPVAHGGTLVLLQNRTHVRRLEVLVAQRARLAALGETAAGLAHELRNAMGAIVGYARLVARSPGEEAAVMAAQIEREAAEMEAMLARFLEVARPAALQKITCDGPGLVRETLERFRERYRMAGIDLTAEGPGPVVLSLDPVWFKQVMANLLENALQHVPRGGRVDIRWQVSDTAWRIQVADDGPGIPPEWRDRVLAPFVSLRQGGTGLGLALVQKVMTAHDGRVEIGASPDGGAEVSLTFPRTGETEDPSGRDRREGSPAPADEPAASP